MADDSETQTNLSDEAADNYPGDFGRLYDPSLEGFQEPRQQVLGVVCDPGYPSREWLAGALREQSAAQRGFACEGMRTSLAATLLQSVARETSVDRWSDVAAKALAAATVIYPDPKEAE